MLQRRALTRIQHGLVADVFWTWLDMATQLREKRETMLARTAARLLHRTLSIVFEAWAGAVHMEATRIDGIAIKVIGRLRNHTMAKCDRSTTRQAYQPLASKWGDHMLQ